MSYPGVNLRNKHVKAKIKWNNKGPQAEKRDVPDLIYIISYIIHIYIDINIKIMRIFLLFFKI